MEIFTALGFGVPGPDPAEQSLNLEASRRPRAAVLAWTAVGTSGRSFDEKSAAAAAADATDASSARRGRSGRHRSARVRATAHAGQTDGTAQRGTGTSFGLADRALPEEVTGGEETIWKYLYIYEILKIILILKKAGTNQ